MFLLSWAFAVSSREYVEGLKTRQQGAKFTYLCEYTIQENALLEESGGEERRCRYKRRVSAVKVTGK
ncbi:MAG: hypothetical protein D3910_11430 [Candidatus Electrothrix sp. ATG2]|nr:hypothetical protein [Candidatus Electrothrix sp. ATG2]